MAELIVCLLSGERDGLVQSQKKGGTQPLINSSLSLSLRHFARFDRQTRKTGSH